MKTKILFLMTGSIACYKACNLISKLVQNNFEVQVVASPSALQFVGEATLEGLSGRPVESDLFERGHIMDHIHLIRWADLVVVAPATANYINKMAQGSGEDLLTTLFLAHDFKKPFLIAPAMNSTMYSHPLTQKSLGTLKEMGIQILETASGILACGETGWGKLLDPDLIFQEIQKSLAAPKQAVEKPTLAKHKMPKVMVTFGGTQEPIDGVRVLSNVSSGRTGAQMTDALSALGYEVTAICAENSARPKYDCTLKKFTNFETLKQIMTSELKENAYDAVIHLAAVSDYSLDKIFPEKIDSTGPLTLQLKQNPKLVDQIREHSRNKNLTLISFKLTNTMADDKRKASALKLLERSKSDLVVQNDFNDIKAGQRHFTVYSQGHADFFADIGSLSSYIAHTIYEKSGAHL